MSESPFRDRIHLFIYGTLLRGGGAEALLDGCERVGPATVQGTLYDIAGRHPALVLAGTTAVHGEVWRCPTERLETLDRYEAVDGGLFRRVGVEVAGRGCWTYVAGAALVHELRPERRIGSGRWLAER